MTSAPPLRVANCSGFYGDRLSAAREMVEGGPLDVLTGDWLAEVTLWILARAREKDPQAGFAATFLRQMEEVLPAVAARGVQVVSNAGGLAPAACAERTRALLAKAGLSIPVAHLEGDDLRGRLPGLDEPLLHLEHGRSFRAAGLTPLVASAYLGGWGIARALREGAQVVVCPRVADASLVVGPAIARFGWTPADLDALAGAVVAGHVLECGTQATGGNYAFFRELPGMEHPGFPLVELEADGSFVVTKHPGTGGMVTVGTVTAQLLYEIEGARYLHPDVVARFDTVRLEHAGADRVRVWGVRGETAPPRAKLCLIGHGGWRNSMTVGLLGLDLDAKASLLERSLRARLGERGPRLSFDWIREARADACTTEEAAALLRVTATDPDPRKVGRAFSAAVVEMALASYPGLFATHPPESESPVAVLWPTTVAREHVREEVVLADGRRLPVPHPPTAPARPDEADEAPPAGGGASAGPTRAMPLGFLCGARSGDKGGRGLLGVWARTDEAYTWLAGWLDERRLVELLPECAPYPVRREALPQLRALVFVIPGLLGEGALGNGRLDAQAKALGELLRARVVELPARLVPASWC